MIRNQRLLWKVVQGVHCTKVPSPHPNIYTHTYTSKKPKERSHGEIRKGPGNWLETLQPQPPADTQGQQQGPANCSSHCPRNTAQAFLEAVSQN